MEITTLAYLERNGAYLMMHRTKKEQDINKDKYIGVGGHIEHGESPKDCMIRETFEETGIMIEDPKLRGIITFVIDDYDEYTFLYTCDLDRTGYGTDGDGDAGRTECFDGKTDPNGTGPGRSECREGTLEWIPKDQVCKLPIWEGDKVMFDLLNTREDVFSLKLVYQNDVLVDVKID